MNILRVGLKEHKIPREYVEETAGIVTQNQKWTNILSNIIIML